MNPTIRRVLRLIKLLILYNTRLLIYYLYYPYKDICLFRLEGFNKKLFLSSFVKARIIKTRRRLPFFFQKKADHKEFCFLFRSVVEHVLKFPLHLTYCVSWFYLIFNLHTINSKLKYRYHYDLRNFSNVQDCFHYLQV